jgi:L-amino acid N-acyltransferase
MTDLDIRLATVADAPAIDDIYNHYVRTSTCTYQRDPEPPEVRVRALIEATAAHPQTVAELGGEVVAFGSLSSFRERWGYRLTVESSVYVRAGQHRRGIGRAVLVDLVARARALGHHTMIAGISAEQHASIALHEQLGFREVARFREVGHKLGQWLDLMFMQLMLDEGLPSKT